MAAWEIVLWFLKKRALYVHELHSTETESCQG